MPTPLPDIGRSLAQQQQDVLLAMLIFGEARGETQEVKKAVANVVLNRWRFGGFGKTLTHVILAPNQFSCFNANDINHTKMYRPLFYEKADVWDQCYFAGLTARLGIHEDPTNGATFYHDSRLGHPPKDWGPVEKTVQLGHLTFYRSLPKLDSIQKA